MSDVKRPCRMCGREIKRTRGSRCYTCTSRIRRYRIKRALVKLLGSVCTRCGWSGHIAAFEFHHRSPQEKSFEISENSNRSWLVVVEEAKKCDLVCSNCHRIEHSGLRDEKFLSEVDKYPALVIPNEKTYPVTTQAIHV